MDATLISFPSSMPLRAGQAALAASGTSKASGQPEAFLRWLNGLPGLRGSEEVFGVSQNAAFHGETSRPEPRSGDDLAPRLQAEEDLARAGDLYSAETRGADCAPHYVCEKQDEPEEFGEDSAGSDCGLALIMACL